MKEEFAKIKEEFNSVFKQLFGGGKGTLELLEDEDIRVARDPYYRPATGKEASEHDAAFRRREGIDCDRAAVCDSELKAVTVLSAG